MLCAMSRRAAVAALESIDGVGRGGRTNVRLKPFTVDNINRAVEQTGNVIFEAGVVKDSDPGCRVKFNHDVNVAVGPVIAACTRAEQGSVTDTPRAQRRFVFPQPGKDFLTVTVFYDSRKNGVCQWHSKLEIARLRGVRGR